MTNLQKWIEVNAAIELQHFKLDRMRLMVNNTPIASVFKLSSESFVIKTSQKLSKEGVLLNLQ